VKLEGSLDAFGLPDIFQLLSYTKKTGGLHLRRGSVHGVVYFSSGAVTGACSDLSRQTLARRLVGSGAVGDDALGAAVTRAKSEGIGVGRALLEANAVPDDLLQQAAADQAVDAVFDLLGWPEGDFAFSVDESNPDDLGVQLATERVVTEAAARRETADRAAGQIAAPTVVLAMPVVPPAEREMSPDEWALMALADGRRTVGDIAELTGSGYVTVVQALAALASRGLLEPAGDDDHASAVRRRLAMLSVLESDAGSSRASAPAAPRADDSAGTAPAASAAATSSVPAPRSTGSFVPASPAPAMGSAAPASTAPEADESRDEPGFVTTIGGPHVPTDVVPPRPEPFQPPRQPDHPEALPAKASRALFDQPRPDTRPDSRPDPRPTSVGASVPASVGAAVGGVNGSAAMAADPEAAAVIERDPSVNRSLLLRLIAGVRGL